LSISIILDQNETLLLRKNYELFAPERCRHYPLFMESTECAEYARDHIIDKAHNVLYTMKLKRRCPRFAAEAAAKRILSELTIAECFVEPAEDITGWVRLIKNQDLISLVGGGAGVVSNTGILLDCVVFHGSELRHSSYSALIMFLRSTKTIIFLIPDLHHPRPERNIIAPK